MDIKSDFYKRFGYEKGSAELEFIPLSVCLFQAKTIEVGLKLSYGVAAAYRERRDGRIILGRTNSNVKESINIIDIEKFHGEHWARSLVSLLNTTPQYKTGAEILLHCDVEDVMYETQKLCFLSAISKINGVELSAQMLIDTVGASKYQIASLTEGRVAAINAATNQYLTYNPKLENKNVIVVKIRKANRRKSLPKQYYDREYDRINRITGNISAMGDMMYDASNDMMSYVDCNNINVIFKEISEYSKAIRILPDLSGAVVFVENKIIDEFIMVVSSAYEKKTGDIPAFYISD